MRVIKMHYAHIYENVTVKTLWTLNICKPKGNTYILLVGMSTSTASMEISRTVPRKNKKSISKAVTIAQ